MKKKNVLVSVIISSLLIATPLQYVNAEGTVSNSSYFDIQDGVLISYSGSDTNVEVPSEVTSIGRSAFSGNTTMISVTLPESVVDIDAYAFSNCTALQNIHWSSSLQSIGDSAFAGCSSITDLYLPGTLDTIGSAVFSRCNNLQNVYVPKSFPDPSGSFITYGPFLYNDADFTVIFEDGITRIPNSLFESSAISEISIPNTVTEIGAKAFLSCENLTKVSLPENLQSIGSQAFNHCSSLESVWIPKSLQNVGGGFGYGPFTNCPSLKYINFQEGITDIPDNLFSGSDITEFVVPDTVTSIGNRSFYDCNQLSKLVIPESVTSIGNEMVALSENVTIYCMENSAAYLYAVQNGIPYVIQGGESGQETSTPIFHVVDAETMEDISGAIISLTDGTNSYKLETTENGTGSISVPSGLYDIQVEKDGYTVRTFSYELSAGEFEVPLIGLSKSSVVIGNMVVSEMTQDEIIDAGIDINDPDNQHVFKYQITLVFRDGPEIPIIIMKNNNDQLIKQFIGGKEQDELTTEDESGSKLNIKRVSEYMYMIVQGEARWQKEMFHAQLLVLNTSRIDDLENCTATINLPDGLSLAAMNSESQMEEVELGTIKKESTGLVEWYIRGDETGDYNVSALLTGNFSSLGDKFSYEFKTSEPLHVYAGTDMQITVHLSDAAYYEKPYTMIFELENVSDHPIYNVTHKVDNISQYQVIEYTTVENGEVVNNEDEWNKLTTDKVGSNGTVEKDVFNPGEKLVVLVKTNVIWQSPLERMKEIAERSGNAIKLAGYMVGVGGTVAIPGLSQFAQLMSYIDVRYYLTSAMYSELEGSTTTIPIQFDIEHQEGVNITEKVLADLIDGLTSFVKEYAINEIRGEDDEFGSILGGVTSVFKKETTNMKVDLYNNDTECIAWVESADGSSNVLSISAEGAKKDDQGRLIFKGSQEISVTALNTGDAFLVIQNADGNVVSKQFHVKESFPGQDYFGDFEDLLNKDKVVLEPGTFVSAEMMDFITDDLDLSLIKGNTDLEIGDVMPTGTRIQDPASGEGIDLIVPGDTNSDAYINLFDGYRILDARNGDSALSDSQKFAGDINQDGKNDTTDMEYLYDYLTEPEINSRSISIASHSATVDISQIVEGISDIRGIQIDMMDLQNNGLESISGNNAISADFSRTVYNSDSDYLRTIIASYDNTIDLSNAFFTVDYNSDTSSVTVPTKVYIQTASDTIVKDINITLSNESGNIGDADDTDQLLEKINGLLAEYEDLLNNSQASDDTKAEFQQVIENVKNSISADMSSEDLKSLIQDLTNAYDKFTAGDTDIVPGESDGSKPDEQIPPVGEETINELDDNTSQNQTESESNISSAKKKDLSGKKTAVKTGDIENGIMYWSVICILSLVIIIRRVHRTNLKK